MMTTPLQRSRRAHLDVVASAPQAGRFAPVEGGGEGLVDGVGER